jgi:NAD(P)-dependent dehydrogenase (short-subunit alcohol dehydrogenase family)
MELGLKDKTVVITGGTAGIGRACVDAFLAEGCKVAVCARSGDKLEQFGRDYAGRPALAIQADTSVPEDMDRLAAAAFDAFGSLDVWVNNAGIYPAGNLMDMPLEEWRHTLAVNLDGVLHGCRSACPYMRRQGKGVLLNASSFAANMPTAGRGAYGITKGAVQQLTKVLAAELAKDNIRVASYMPGFVSTDLNAGVTSESGDEALFDQVALHRYGTVREVASVVVFLASDAASFITGRGIEVDGGKYCVQNPWHAWRK